MGDLKRWAVRAGRGPSAVVRGGVLILFYIICRISTRYGKENEIASRGLVRWREAVACRREGKAPSQQRSSEHRLDGKNTLTRKSISGVKSNRLYLSFQSSQGQNTAFIQAHRPSLPRASLTLKFYHLLPYSFALVSSNL